MRQLGEPKQMKPVCPLYSPSWNGYPHSESIRRSTTVDADQQARSESC